MKPHFGQFTVQDAAIVYFMFKSVISGENDERWEAAGRCSTCCRLSSAKQMRLARDAQPLGLTY